MLSAIDVLIHRFCIKLAPDALLVHGLRSRGANALVTEGRQIEVVGVLAYSSSEAKQFRSVRPGLAVVFCQVGMQVHYLLVIPYGYFLCKP